MTFRGKPSERGLILLSAFIYFAGYMNRIGYAAALPEIIRDLQITKSQAGIAVTGCFAAYGIGQVISGILGDRYKASRLILIGLLGTAAINFGVGFIRDINVITVMWCVNGLLQSLLWPPLVRILSVNLSEKNYTRAVTLVVVGTAAATAAVYFTVPAAIEISGWRLAFLVFSGIAVIAAALWTVCGYGLADRKACVTDTAGVKAPEAVSSALSRTMLKKAVISGGLLPIAAAIILHGILRDGLMTWLPSYIGEVYALDNSSSIVSAAIIPAFTAASVYVSAFLCGALKNELATSAVLFGVGTLCAALLIVFFGSGAALSVILIAIICGCMYGINLMLISKVPLYFAKYNVVSTVSGALNACTYIGAALSIYGIAALSEHIGWKATVGVWTAVAGAGMVICLLLIVKWKHFTAGAEAEEENQKNHEQVEKK